MLELVDWKEIISLAQPVPDSTFDPALYFEEWQQAIETFRNQGPADLRPGVYLESDEPDFADPLSLDPQFPDQIRSEGTLVVTEYGKLQTANIEVTTAIIDGLFKGKITARQHVLLENHALVIGEINTPSLTIRGGAIIEGRCYFEPPEQLETLDQRQALDQRQPLDQLEPLDQWEQSGWQAFKVGISRVWRSRIVQ